MPDTPNKPTTPAQPTIARPLTKRGTTRMQREQRRQRMVVIGTASAIGVAVLAIVIGLLFDRVWTPSRPVAQVSSQTLSRRDYWAERRNEIARNIAQNLQLLRLFGAQAAQQFAGQGPQLESLIPSIRTAPVDQATVDTWINRQVIVQGAQSEGITANDGAVAQALVNDLGRVFPAPPPLITQTGALSGTAVSGTAAPAAGTSAPTAAAAATGGPTAAAGGATAAATSGPTETPSATPTPQPTLTADASLQDRDALIQRIYEAYRTLILSADSQANLNLTVDDFKTALNDQYLQQALTTQVEAKLVPEAGFQASTEPSSIVARQILLKVDVPANASEAERDALFEQRKPAADGVLQQLRSTNGANFAELAKTRSDDVSTKNSGGTLPSFDLTGKTSENTQIDPAFVAAAVKLQVNQISDLVRTPFGWHIIQVTSRNVDSTEVQLSRARTKAFDEWTTKQRTALNIEHFPAQTPTATPAPTSTTAQALPTAPLAGVITSTNGLSGTNGLTNTNPLTGTNGAAGTAIPASTSPAGTSVPASTSAATAPAASTSPAGTSVPASTSAATAPAATAAPTNTEPTATP